MPYSISSAFSEPEEFETAMRPEGWLSMLVTARGQFRARLSQIALNEIHLLAAEEQLSRIAFVAVPEDLVMIVFPIGRAMAPVCGGLRIQVGELMTLWPGARFHTRIAGASHWGMIKLKAEWLGEYGIALTGTVLPIPQTLRRWRPPAAGLRELRGLHSTALR